MATVYEKEKQKVSILVGIGLILLFIFLIGVISEYGFKDTFASFSDGGTWFIFLLITCYPLGIVYGWRRMIGEATTSSYPHSGPADRYYTVLERNVHKNNTLMGWVLSVALVIAFGWIFGTIRAIKRLIYLKKNK